MDRDKTTSLEDGVVPMLGEVVEDGELVGLW